VDGFPDEGLAAFLDLDRGVGVDHVAVILGQLVVHRLRGMAEKVAMLVDRAALDGQVLAPERHERGFQPWGTVDNHELRPLQAARIEIGEELAPGRLALSTHILDG